ncbi:MAG: hypothetical protein AAFY72_10575, partial [Cyanobacteria bacterium J06649_4]
LHTYFRIGDINQVSVLGLADRSYLDKVDEGQQKTQSGDVVFTGECDRIYGIFGQRCSAGSICR